MFGIGLPEMLFIFALALIVLGPEQLPKVAQQLGRFFRELKNTGEEFRKQLDIEDIKDLKGIREEVDDWEKEIISPQKAGSAKKEGPGGLGGDWKIASGPAAGAPFPASTPESPSKTQDTSKDGKGPDPGKDAS